MDAIEYRPDFYEFLTENEHNGRRFLRIYGDWRAVRSKTILQAEILARSCNDIKRDTTIVKGTSAIFRLSAGLSYISYGLGLISPTAAAAAKGISIASHAVDIGATVIDVARTNECKTRISSVLQNDCSVSSKLFDLGFDFKLYHEAVRLAAEQFKRMTISRRMQESSLHDIFNKISNHELNGTNFLRQVAELVTLLPIYMQQAIDMTDVFETVQYITRDNPQLTRITQIATHALLDMFSYSAIGSQQKTDLFSLGIVDHINNLAVMNADRCTVTRTYRSLQHSDTSVTGEQISNVVKVLRAEEEYVTSVYNRLLRDMERTKFIIDCVQ